MPRVRLGCVPYLNARPLIAYFETAEGRDLAEVVYAEPSEFGGMLERGELDLALASSFFAIESPRFGFAPNVAITSRGAVESVRLFSKVPISEIVTLALDASSMTSNHLARILLAERYGVIPACTISQPDLDVMLARSDAALLIGNRGLAADGDGLRVVDLGAAWTDWTGLPFVWAMWVGVGDVEKSVADLVLTAKEFGRERIAEIAREESVSLGIAEGRCLRYLAEVIDFDLGPEQLSGFERFAELCRKRGFVRDAVSP